MVWLGVPSLFYSWNTENALYWPDITYNLIVKIFSTLYNFQELNGNDYSVSFSFFNMIHRDILGIRKV